MKLRVIVFLKKNGLSLQKVKKGIKNLSESLPDSDDPLSRLIIHTDGIDMIVFEKGKYFSAITKQRYFRFDTAQIKADIIDLQKIDKTLPKSIDITKGIKTASHNSRSPGKQTRGA